MNRLEAEHIARPIVRRYIASSNLSSKILQEIIGSFGTPYAEHSYWSFNFWWYEGLRAYEYNDEERYSKELLVIKVEVHIFTTEVMVTIGKKFKQRIAQLEGKTKE